MSILGQLDPLRFAASWNFVTVASKASPGHCVISGAAREYKYDVKEGKGTTGSTTTFVNKPPAKFSIKFFLWDNGTLGTGHNHFAEWDDLLPLLKYDPTKPAGQAQAVDIFHPALDAIDVKSVVVTKIGQLDHDGDGMYSITIEFLEYLPASKTSAVSTPSGSKANAPGWVDASAQPGTQADTAVAAAQKEANDLAKQAQQAAA